MAVLPSSTVAPQQQPCREYQSTAVIDGRPQATFGTACLQPDGSWRIVR
jgi:surface antigen